MKTKLYLKVFTEDVNHMKAKLTTCETWKEHTTETENETGEQYIKERFKRKQISEIDYFYTSDARGQATAFFCGYVNYIIPSLVYTALKTVYSKSGDKTVYDRMNECISYARRNENSQEQFELYLSSSENDLVQTEEETETINHILEYMTDRQRTPRNQSERNTLELEKLYARERKESIVKQHTYKVCKDSFGNTYRRECVPFETQEKTIYGRVKDREQKSGYCESVMLSDLISVAKVALFTLFGMNLLNSPADVFNYRNFVYKCINTYIHAEKAFSVHNESLYCTFSSGTTTETESTYSEKVLSMKQADKQLSRIETSTVLDKLSVTLESLLDKRSNKKNILVTFRLYYIEQYTLKEIAEKLKVSEVAISKYNKQILKALKNPLVYETLKSCINN